MNRIEKKFRELKQKKKKAVIAFITAGYPSLKVTKELVLAFAKLGVDIIELGVPFSDPLADGPIIQRASQAALGRKVTLKKILTLVKNIRRQSQVPLCLMTYFNPLLAFGEKRFIRRASLSGVDGVIIPDLPPEEGRDFIRAANRQQLEVICFIAPTTSPRRIGEIAKITRGFINYVSLTGVTGPRQKLPPDLLLQLGRIKRMTDKPVCVGFGIASREQVRQINRVADGVIVGSAIVNKIKENIAQADLVKKVADFVKRLKA